MNHRPIPVAVLSFVLALGCSSSASAPATGDLSVTSDSGKLHVAVHFDPSPPVRGSNTATFTITDATSGVPLDGLSLQVVPWMPAHDHGGSVTPTVTPKGGGVYEATNVYLFMPGEWELRATMTSSAVNDHAAPTVEIP